MMLKMFFRTRSKSFLLLISYQLSQTLLLPSLLLEVLLTQDDQVKECKIQYFRNQSAIPVYVDGDVCKTLRVNRGD